MSFCNQNFNWITENLAVGNIYAGTDLKTLREHGIDVIVAATPKLPMNTDVYSKNGFSLLHVPLLDLPSQNIQQWFKLSNEFIKAHHQIGRKVLVHCMAGISRSVTLVAAYLIFHNGWSVDQTIEFIRKGRSCANPNNGFQMQLDLYRLG